MIIVPPEADLVARLDPELISQRLWDDNLTLGADTVSHTHKYNLATLSLLLGGSPVRRGPTGTGLDRPEVRIAPKAVYRIVLPASTSGSGPRIRTPEWWCLTIHACERVCAMLS